MKNSAHLKGFCGRRNERFKIVALSPLPLLSKTCISEQMKTFSLLNLNSVLKAENLSQGVGGGSLNSCHSLLQILCLTFTNPADNHIKEMKREKKIGF